MQNENRGTPLLVGHRVPIHCAAPPGAAVFLLMAAGLLAAPPPWPPESSSCSECRQSTVLEQPSCPGNQQVTVTHNGGAGSITFDQFLDRLGDADNTTYVIAASDTPYVAGCRTVYIGSYGLNGKRTCVTIRGETGNREDVVIVGEDPAVDPDYWKSPQYGGPSPCNAGQFIQLFYCEHIVIADLTMRNFPAHMIKLDGGYSNGTAWYPRDVVLHNLELHDCGDQFIKGASGAAENPIGCADGLLSCSYIRYTDGLFRESTYETQGIDLHEGHNWVVRDNVFENIRIDKDAAHGGNGAAVLMWDRSDSILVERNLIINCNSAVKLGASWEDDGCNDMSAINNVVVYDDPDPRYRSENTFDVGVSVTRGMVAHNTVWNPAKDPAYSFAVCKTDYTFSNNLYLIGTTHRCAFESHNVQIADSSWFVSVGAFDFRPTTNRTAPSVGVTRDAAGVLRGDPPTVGAFEWAQDAVHSTVIRHRVPHVAGDRNAAVYDLRGRMVPRQRAGTDGAWIVRFRH
ncbi:MAG: hypothetical protein GF331_17300 [Chitinivibrionales bacterium]|nr:hypothetical protein [Chitinivibrionales bacterium]